MIDYIGDETIDIFDLNLDIDPDILLIEDFIKTLNEKGD